MIKIIFILPIMFIVNCSIIQRADSNIEQHVEYDINKEYGRSYNIKELTDDSTMILDTSNYLNIILLSSGINNESILASDRPKKMDTFYTIYSDINLEKMWVCNFENKLIKEYHLSKDDTSFKYEYEIEPVFHIIKTTMYSPETGDLMNTKLVERYLNANKK